MKKLSISVMAIGLSFLAFGCAVSEPSDSEEAIAPSESAAREELQTSPKEAPGPSLLVEYCEDVNGTSCLGNGSKACFLRYDGVWSSCLCRSKTWVCAL